MKSSGIITLTTDFGLSDSYVGILKGTILAINPKACLIDICHNISLGDIERTSDIIYHSTKYFPNGTIHLAIVDPEVGTSRRPIAVDTGYYTYIGPDNGIFSEIIKEQNKLKIIHLNKKEFFLSDISSTFHGRDIFAPVAAHLSIGTPLNSMGIPLSNPVILNFIPPEIKDNRLTGRIRFIDHFGNIITNLDKASIEIFLDEKPIKAIRIGEVTLKNLYTSYGHAPDSEPIALIGSSGFLEISVNMARADEKICGAKPYRSLLVEILK